jgi:hypothetical protein
MVVPLTAAAHAQVNIEQVRPDTTDGGVSGSLGVDMTFRTGNVDIVKLKVSGRLDYAAGGFRTFVLTGGDFGWESGDAFSNEAILHLRQVFRADARVKPETFEQINYDKRRALTFRGLLGGGLRVTVLQWSGSRVWFGTAYMFERERLELPADAVHPDQTWAHRWSNYLSARIAVTESAGIVWTVYAQPRFDDFEDVRVLGDTRMEVRVGGPVSLVTSFLLRWDSRPPDDIEALDTTLGTGLRLRF